MKAAIIVMLALGITGCAGAPVGWGGTHKVLHRDENIITITYDLTLESFDDVMAIANAHCHQFSKTPFIANVYEDPLTMGLIKTYTFRCSNYQ